MIDALARMGEARDTREVLEQLVTAAGSLTAASSSAVQIVETAGANADGLTRELVSWAGPLDNPTAPADTDVGPGSRFARPRLHELDRPLRLDQEVEGQLRLRAVHPFSSAHRRLADTLVAAAEVALVRARTLAATTHHLRRLEAVAEVQDALLSSTDTAAVLRLVAQRAREVVGADTSAVVVPTGPDELIVEVAAGRDAAHITGRRVGAAGTLLGEVVTSGRAVIVDDLTTRAHGLTLWPSQTPGSAALVPLRTSHTVRGVLLVASHTSSALGLTEASVLGAFAGQAALAIERAQARDDRLRVSLYEDRERIARDLHDHVIQRLFAAGLTLQRWADRSTEPQVAAGVHGVVEDIDVAITAIRALIHQLQSPPDRQSFQAAVQDIVGDASAALGFPVTFEEEAHLDHVPDHLREDVLAVLREALSNVVRHAHAHAASVHVSVDDHVRLTVQDDGVGLGGDDRRSGLANLARRAEAHGGQLIVEPHHPGTRLQWEVPVSDATRP
jgi:signal transduction histidine kinase